jgi:flavin-dependent dehydrogenase
MDRYDIIIVGSGPAGATLARLLDERYRILLVDRRPLHKSAQKVIKNCGGLIAPDAQKALASFGLSLPVDILVTPQTFAVETLDFDNNMIQSYQRHYVNVDRELFDRWLLSLCDTQNVQKSFSTHFMGAKKTKDGYIVTLKKENKRYEVFASMIVGADGANSKVKRDLMQKENEPEKYVSIQEWFENKTELNRYVAIFDNEISDFYSWVIPKGQYIIFGSAIKEGDDVHRLHELQKVKLARYGYDLSAPVKRLGSYILRPKSFQDISLGTNDVALIGEAAGFISPTSAEGISYAMISGAQLAQALNKDMQNFASLYRKNSISLRCNIIKKMLKYPFMYNRFIRKIIFKANIGTLDIKT